VKREDGACCSTSSFASLSNLGFTLSNPFFYETSPIGREKIIMIGCIIYKYVKIAYSS